MENNLSIKPIAIKFGIIAGIIMVASSALTHALGTDYLWVNWIGSLSYIGLIIFGIKLFRTENNDTLTLIQALKVGVAIALIASILSGIYTYIYIDFINPTYLADMQELQLKTAIEANPNMPEEQIQLIKDLGEKTSSPVFMFFTGLLGSLIFGFIISLVGGLILKTPPKFENA